MVRAGWRGQGSLPGRRRRNTRAGDPDWRQAAARPASALQPTAKPVRIRAAAEGEDDRQRALPTLDVAADRLAGYRGIAPDAEKVIARLERQSESAAELGEAVDTVGIAAGDGRSACHGSL